MSPKFRTYLIVFVALLSTSPAGAQDLAAYLWISRPVVVFADTPNDPRFIRQMEMLGEDETALTDRDVVVLSDTDPAAKSALRQKLRPRGFMLVIMGKDGKVKMRKPRPWSVREISRAIDKMPLRRDEMKQHRGE